MCDLSCLILKMLSPDINCCSIILRIFLVSPNPQVVIISKKDDHHSIILKISMYESLPLLDICVHVENLSKGCDGWERPVCCEYLLLISSSDCYIKEGRFVMGYHWYY